MVKYNVGLAKYTSFKVGGAAKIYCKPDSLQELSSAIMQFADVEPIVWLGLGSNVLISDRGVNGLVIHTHNVLNEITILDRDCSSMLVKVGAGVSCAKLAKFCVQYNLADGIWFAGIPGTVGGALAMNAGAFGSDTWRHVVVVTVIDSHGQLATKNPGNYQIGYRSVVNVANNIEQINQVEQREWFIGGELKFKFADSDVNSAYNQKGHIELQQQIKLLLQQRKATQPIGTLNCGSVFKNPLNNWAGKLIESSNLKNKTIGGAAVSAKHANFIINDGSATANDIEQLICLIQEQVLTMHGVLLEPEVRLIGG